MKRNKIAAGALALALGLGAVAPSFADTLTPLNTNTTTTSTTNSTVRNSADKGQGGVGNFVIHEDFRIFETEFVKAWKALETANLNLANAEKAEAAAAKAYQDAKDALAAFEKTYASNYSKMEEQYNIIVMQHNDLVRNNVTLVYGDGTSGLKPLEGKIDFAYWTEDLHGTQSLVTFAKRTSATPTDYTNARLNAAVEELNNDIDRLNRLIKVYNDSIVSVSYADLTLKVQETKKAYEVATQAREKAEAAQTSALSKYATTKTNFVNAGAQKNIIDEAERRGDLSLVTTAVTSTVTNPVTETKTDVKVSEKVTSSTSTTTNPNPTANNVLTEAKRAQYEKVLADAKEQIAAVKLLKEMTPETIKGVVGKLDALVAKQEANIKTVEAFLKANPEKKTVSNLLFSTAYASEEATSVEDIDALINEIDASTNEIKDVLKENEEANKKANEEAAAEKPADEKPADEKPADEKPADKEDDKKEDKADDKKEDKADDKAEASKPAATTTAKPAATASANKSAGSNAKTGIAGVAGVAGVLAAASVAYAASKKN